MFMFIFFFAKVFDEVYMLSIANFNSTGGLSAELMEMSVRKVSAELHFMVVVIPILIVDSFTGYGAESVIVTFIAFNEK